MFTRIPLSLLLSAVVSAGCASADPMADDSEANGVDRGTEADAVSREGVTQQPLLLPYSCEGKDDGNYIHPTDCRKFISCTNERAAEMDCAICHIDLTTCPTGRLYYNSPTDSCEYLIEAGCVIDPLGGLPLP
jgi:Chitin binding Peritrophin-A domain